MKKTIFMLIILFLFYSLIVAQTNVDTAELQRTIENIADEIAPALPFAAATTGNNWDDAYIGKLPHFALGVSTGVVLIPSDSIDKLFTLLDIERPEDLESVDYIPLPLYSLDARLGGLVWPFDIGIKAGIYNNNADKESSSGSSEDLLIDYALFGADLRYALVEQSLLLPDISIGVGFNYYKTNVRTQLDTGNFGDSIEIENIPGLGSTVELGRPDVGLSMESTSVDFKAQISKSLLILRPFAGIGTSYGKSTVSADFYADYSGLSSTEIQFLKAAGYSVEDTSIYYESEYTGWSSRVFAGIGIQVFILKLNAQLSYNLETEAVAGTINGRIQF